MLRDVWSLVEPALTIADPDAAGRALFAALQPYGVSYLQTRSYRRPLGPLTSASHFAAGGLVTRVAPPEWPGSDAFAFVCFHCNPQLDAVRAGRTRHRFGDYAPRSDRGYGRYWDALSEAGIAETLCATAYGPDRRIASIHLGVSDPRPDADHAQRLQDAGALFVERLLQRTTPPDAPPLPALTGRERECLGLVADGKTDWEISVILTLSEATVRFHVDNARRKLGAVTRAQAAARLALAGLI